MSRIGIDEAASKDFSEISEYYASGSSKELPQYLQNILKRWRSANDILMKFTKKSVAVRKLQALYPDITLRQAYIDIENACKFWNIHDKKDKDFLYRFLVENLMESITNKSTPDIVKSKNYATLQKLYASIESDPIDPKFMEKSTVNIQFNINQNNILFSEKEIASLPAEIRQKLLALTQSTINEENAIEIMQS